MILYYAYSADNRYHLRQFETRYRLARLQSAWQRAGHRLLVYPVGPDDRYEAQLRRMWGTDDIIVLEQDIVPSWGHLQGFIACPHPLCTVAYALNQPVAHGQFHGELVQRNYRPNGSRYWVPYGTEWADLTGLGFVRIRRAWQLAHPPAWDAGVWSDLDARLSWWTYQQGIHWHMHYPLARHAHFGEGYVPA